MIIYTCFFLSSDLRSSKVCLLPREKVCCTKIHHFDIMCHYVQETTFKKLKITCTSLFLKDLFILERMRMHSSWGKGRGKQFWSRLPWSVELHMGLNFLTHEIQTIAETKKQRPNPLGPGTPAQHISSKSSICLNSSYSLRVVGILKCYL